MSLVKWLRVTKSSSLGGQGVPGVCQVSVKVVCARCVHRVCKDRVRRKAGKGKVGVARG